MQQKSKQIKKLIMKRATNQSTILGNPENKTIYPIKNNHKGKIRELN